MEIVSRSDSFKTERIGKVYSDKKHNRYIYRFFILVCDLVAQGAIAIFGPSTILTSGIATAICDTLEIPHIITHWKPQVLGQRVQKQNMTINIYPDTEVLAQAFAELIVDYDWKSYTIIYENNENLMKLKDVLQIHEPQDHPRTVRKLPTDHEYRPFLKEIVASGENNIVLDISADKIVNLLRQADEVKMMNEYQSFIITSLDTHVIDFEEIKATAANITSLRILNPSSADFKQAVYAWNLRGQKNDRSFHLSPEHVQVFQIKTILIASFKYIL